jgi:hypothetical protein
MFAPAITPVTAGKKMPNWVNPVQFEAAFNIRRKICLQRLGGKLRKRARKESCDRKKQRGKNKVLELYRPSCTDERYHTQDNADGRADDTIGGQHLRMLGHGRPARARHPGRAPVYKLRKALRINLPTQREKSLGKSYNIHRDRYRLREKERDPDRAAELDAERAGNKEISPPALYFLVRGDRGK